ncbi:MAG: pseudouridine synthase, partial [Planctomycetota bacterium]
MTQDTRAKVRLQKFLSDAGVASRRRAEELIEEGHVLVNNEVVSALPAFVDPRQDRVVVDGVAVRLQKLEYWMVHKPKGFVSTNRDPAGRRRVIDLLPERAARLFPVGRLDVDSTGLLLLTNDGELSERLTHPRYGLPRVYHVEVRGRVPHDIVGRLRGGVHLAEGKARATQVELLHAGSDASVLLVTLREGRNRQVRRMLARLGYPVKKLKRVEFGPLNLKGLPLGAARQLSPRE